MKASGEGGALQRRGPRGVAALDLEVVGEGIVGHNALDLSETSSLEHCPQVRHEGVQTILLEFESQAGAGSGESLRRLGFGEAVFVDRGAVNVAMAQT